MEIDERNNLLIKQLALKVLLGNGYSEEVNAKLLAQKEEVEASLKEELTDG